MRSTLFVWFIPMLPGLPACPGGNASGAGDLNAYLLVKSVQLVHPACSGARRHLIIKMPRCADLVIMNSYLGTYLGR
jgi:hypothetical protein